MPVPFRKMHGLGNDFVVLDARQSGPDGPLEMSERRARALTDRMTGIGCDQLIVLEPSHVADVRMRIYNHDGGEVEACGNATRAIGLLLGGERRIETAGGLLHTRAADGGIAVDMGEPRFDWQAIPLAWAMDTLHMPVGWDELADPAAVNVGNPHVIFFVEPDAGIDMARIGPVIENDPLFPQRVNVNFARILGPDRIRLDVWERGAGLTRACGTGACATMVAAARRKLVGDRATVVLPGGELVIEWREGGSITMTGPAATAFTGEVELADYPA